MEVFAKLTSVKRVKELEQERIDALGVVNGELDLVVSDAVAPADRRTDRMLVVRVNPYAESLEAGKGDFHRDGMPRFVDIAKDKEAMFATQPLLHEELERMDQQEDGELPSPRVFLREVCVLERIVERVVRVLEERESEFPRFANGFKGLRVIRLRHARHGRRRWIAISTGGRSRPAPAATMGSSCRCR